MTSESKLSKRGLEGSITWKTYLHWKQHPDQDRGGSLWFGLSQRYTLFLQIWFHSSLFSWIFVQTTESASSRFWKMGFVKKKQKTIRTRCEVFKNKETSRTNFLSALIFRYELLDDFHSGFSKVWHDFLKNFVILGKNYYQNLFKYASFGRNLKTELRLYKK